MTNWVETAWQQERTFHAERGHQMRRQSLATNGPERHSCAVYSTHCGMLERRDDNRQYAESAENDALFSQRHLVTPVATRVNDPITLLTLRSFLYKKKKF